MSDIEHCEACGQPVREWSGKRNDLIGLSSMWAKRARTAEAEVESLRAQLAGDVGRITELEQAMVRAAEKLESFGNEEPVAVASVLRDTAQVAQ